MSEIVIGDQSIPYTLVRSDRVRRIRFDMDLNGFRVVVPIYASGDDIRGAMLQKKKWIIRSHHSLEEKRSECHKLYRFQSGAKIPYWGRLSRLQLEASDVEEVTVRYRNGFLVSHPQYKSPQTHDESIELGLQSYLRQQFMTEARRLCRKYQQSIGKSPKSLRITQMVTRWGSCSPAGVISLDWRLVYAPKRVASYVVAHEMAHLHVLNHTSEFWRTLRSIYGNFSSEHEWLEANQHRLGYIRCPINNVTSG